MGGLLLDDDRGLRVEPNRGGHRGPGVRCGLRVEPNRDVRHAADGRQLGDPCVVHGHRGKVLQSDRHDEERGHHEPGGRRELRAHRYPNERVVHARHGLGARCGRWLGVRLNAQRTGALRRDLLLGDHRQGDRHGEVRGRHDHLRVV